MAMHPRAWFAALLSGSPRAAAAAVAATGGLVLVGWVFDIPALQGVAPGLAEVQFSTALFFVLSGLALALLVRSPPRPGRRALGRTLAAAACVLAALALLEQTYPTGRDLDLWAFARLVPVAGDPAHG